MNIDDIVTTEFEELPPETTVSKLVGLFDDPDVRGVVVRDDDAFEGVVTRRQLTASQHPPDRKVGSIVWHVPRVDAGEDVREVARLMIDSGSTLLPVFDGERMVGVVTGDDLLQSVEPYLEAATVREAYSDDLLTVAPETSFGKALHLLREHRVAHLPVVEDGTALGILSLYDVVGIATRTMHQSQGGDAGGQDPFGGAISSSTARARPGGYGAREGELARMLDLPVRDVMVSPVETIGTDATLEDAVGAMFAANASSLVVLEDGRATGIVTKTDVLDSLTWEAEGNRAVQLYGATLLDDMSYEDVVAVIDGFERMDGEMTILDAKVHLHEHDETLRGTSLVLARLRLYTDKGLFMASGEGYGASHAINEARDILERRILEKKTYGQSKKKPDEAFWERRFGWWLEG